MTSLNLKREDHGGVAIWSVCQHIDMLLNDPALSCAEGETQSINPGPPRAQNLISDTNCFVPLLTEGPGLCSRCNKGVFAIWKPQSSRFAVVCGSERAHSEMMM